MLIVSFMRTVTPVLVSTNVYWRQLELGAVCALVHKKGAERPRKGSRYIGARMNARQERAHNISVRA